MRVQGYDPVAGNVGDLFPRGGTLRRRGPLPDDPVSPAPGAPLPPVPGTPDSGGLYDTTPPVGAGSPVPQGPKLPGAPDPGMGLPPGIDIGQIVGRPAQPGVAGLPGGQIPMGGAPSARDLIMAELGRRIRR